MKTLVLALDGLEFNQVVGLNLYGLQQIRFGKHYVGFFRNLYTPIIWASFLTGMNMEQHGFDLDSLRNQRKVIVYKNRLLQYLYLVRRKIPIKETKLRGLFSKLGLTYNEPPSIMPKEYRKKTFIEVLKKEGFKVKVIEMPGYNETRNEKYRTHVDKMVFEPFSERQEVIKECLTDVKQRLTETLEYIIRNYDLIVSYSPLPDIAYHLTHCERLVEKAYLTKILVELTKEVEHVLREAKLRNYLVLIVSDHGFDFTEKTHSKYGFWSINRPYSWRPKTILDFRNKIIEWVKM